MITRGGGRRSLVLIDLGDGSTLLAGLEADGEEGALADRGGYAALVPGKPEESELYRRISAEDATQRMPPAKSNLRLTADEVALLRRWIAEGAEYKPHWAFLPLPDAVAGKRMCV